MEEIIPKQDRFRKTKTARHVQEQTKDVKDAEATDLEDAMARGQIKTNDARHIRESGFRRRDRGFRNRASFRRERDCGGRGYSKRPPRTINGSVFMNLETRGKRYVTQ